MVSSEKGFSLIELVFVAGISAFVLTGMMKLYIFTSVQSDLAGSQTVALSLAQSKLEEIRNHTYDNIVADYASGGTPGDTFDLSVIDGAGAISIDSTNTELLEVQIVVCWKDKYNRIVGEDTNLNGVLNTGEDVNGNGVLNSPIELVSYVTRR